MGDVSHEVKKMNFVANKLNLPLFLMSSLEIPSRHDILGHFVHILEKKVRVIRNTVTKKLKHQTGFDYKPRSTCPTARILAHSRDLSHAKDWQLPPNRYGMPKEPFDDFKGAGGAHWSKLHQKKITLTKKKTPKKQWRFYDINTKTMHCNEHKSIFLSDARSRRATTRSMVSNNITCYRNPDDPSSAHYFPKNYTLEKTAAPKIKHKPANPHVFLPHSCVPAKLNSIHARHGHYLPGPGRYEISYQHVCPCTWKLVYLPGLALIIDREKRYKFRRLPFTRIKARNYCSPDWRHVIGHGFRYLFRRPTKIRGAIPKEIKKPKETKKTDREFKLYPDSRYISMINDPNRPVMTFRSEPIQYPPPRVVYNCMYKRLMRHKLSSNKKIAFNSGQERFKDSERALLFTVKQLEKIKSSLPIERQLRDHPIMKKEPNEIVNKLLQTPEHMKPTYELELRKRLFKFLPLPGAKVLVTDADIKVENVGPFYGKEIDPKTLFKDEILYPELIKKNEID